MIERLLPQLVGRPWGGGRYGTIDQEPVGEVWVSGDEAQLPDGSTLSHADLPSKVPLVKLLDVADWLSVQLHPSDHLARRRHGRNAVGKHEAWVVLEADHGARLAGGLVDPYRAGDLFNGDPVRIEGALRLIDVKPGDVIDVPPGTVHSPGPGLLLYEVQQRSDLTYRVWDWGRPRPLHLEEAREALRPTAVVRIGSLPTLHGRHTLVRDAPFSLELWRVDGSDVVAELDQPAVMSILDGLLHATAAGWPDRTEAESGSHWLVRTDELRLEGRGAALLAMRSPGQ